MFKLRLVVLLIAEVLLTAQIIIFGRFQGEAQAQELLLGQVVGLLRMVMIKE